MTKVLINNNEDEADEKIMALAKTYILQIFTKQNIKLDKMWDDDDESHDIFCQLFWFNLMLKGATGEKIWPELWFINRMRRNSSVDMLC